jgi:hypothetical protein
VAGLLLVAVAATGAWARSNAPSGTSPAPAKPRVNELFPRGNPTFHAAVVDNSQRIDVNNVSMVVTNTGSFAYDKGTGNAGLEFPKGTTKTAVFAAGLWLGAQVAGQTRVAVAEYSDEYGPGAMVGTVADDPTKAEYKVYKLSRRYTDTATRDAALADYNAGAVPHGAPVVTADPDGKSLDGILGDQMCWAVYNDADQTNHTNAAGNNGFSQDQRILGVEVQQTTFAFDQQGPLGNTVFIQYRIINKGANTLDNMFVSQWSDPDLGGYTDDLVGCDTGLSVGFVYNSTNADQQYGSSVPSVGIDFFQGPTVAGVPLPMTSFNKYVNGTDPNTAQKTYNYMQGLNADGSTVINPVTNTATAFSVSGDPTSGTGWLDNNPGDRRMMLSSGPFTMAPGDTQVVTTAIVIGQAGDRLSSITRMKCYDATAQSAFDNNFVVASPPNAPIVVATPQDGAVLLTWDNGPETYSQAPYEFEGYVVYQGASIAGPYTRVATYDVDNAVTKIIDQDCDSADPDIPVVKAKGTNSGLAYSIRLTQDAVRGGPLFTGTPYYYVVTAYSAAPAFVPKMLESSFNAATAKKTVVPQTPAGGTDLSTALVTSGPTYGQINPGLPPTTDSVAVFIADPNQVIDADWRVGYKPDAAGIPVWYVTRTVGAVTDTVVNNQTNFSGDPAYPIVDGIQVKVLGAPFKQLLRAEYVDVPPNPPGLVPNPDVGGGFFGGSADYAANIAPTGSALGPADIASFNNVEIRFTGGAAGQKAYRYERCNCAPRNYNFQDFVDVPFTVWDLDNNRQLNVGFLENYPAANGVWDPDPIPDPFDNSAGDDRQFISIYSSTYSPTALVQYQVNWLAEGPNLDLTFTLWADGSTAPLTIDAGDKFDFVLASRSPNDFFAFHTQAASRSNTTLAKNELDRVLAVPNPYFNHSAYELNQFNRQVKFTHLPASCKVRIFNLAGDLVRTMDKNDTSSQLTWDLQTDRGLPVGSGVYIFHVDAPGVGTHVGKVVIFMEKERLTNF